MKPASILDFRDAARRRLPHFLFEYLDGGSYAEQTLRANIEALSQINLRQRVLRDVSAIDTSATLFGKALNLPLVLAPVGLSGMYARRGEVQAARAAEKAGAGFTLSTVSVCPIKEVRGAVQEPFWFQLYMVRDRTFMKDLLRRARDAGCSALVFTVDLPVPGKRYRDARSGLGAGNTLRRAFQIARRPDWAWDVGLQGGPHTLGNLTQVLGDKSGLEDFMGWIGANFDPSVTWADLDFIRAEWSGTLIIKGILDVEDARAAADFGADGIVVSNHGGRQLDGARATASVLPEIKSALGDRMTILADGGVRSGIDVLRMLALGADGVLIGRAFAYALAAGGEAGVTQALTILADELRAAMALTGVTRLDQIDQSVLA